MASHEFIESINGVALRDDAGNVRLVLLDRDAVHAEADELAAAYPELPVLEAIRTYWPKE